MDGGSAKGVEDLEVFRRAYALSITIHRASLALAQIEQYGGLADQLRRSSKSVCALMVEGAGRGQASRTEFVRYLVMAIGSAEEARLWCRYAADLDCVDRATAEGWRAEYGHVIRMLQGLKRSVEA